MIESRRGAPEPRGDALRFAEQLLETQGASFQLAIDKFGEGAFASISRGSLTPHDKQLR
jgi:hypothetical protein